MFIFPICGIYLALQELNGTFADVLTRFEMKSFYVFPIWLVLYMLPFG